MSENYARIWRSHNCGVGGKFEHALDIKVGDVQRLVSEGVESWADVSARIYGILTCSLCDQDFYVGADTATLISFEGNQVANFGSGKMSLQDVVGFAQNPDWTTVRRW